MARNLLIITSKIITSNVPLIRRNTQILNISASYVTVFRKYSNVKVNPSSNESYKEIQIGTLTDFKTKHNPGLKFVSAKLQNLFGLSSTQVKEIFKKYPELKKYSPDLIETNFNACTEAGMSNDTLLQYPRMLTIENVSFKLIYLKQINVDINLIAPIIFANFNVLKKIVAEARLEEQICPYGNRIVYISHLLNIPAPEISEKIIRHMYIFKYPLERLEKIIGILLDYGIEPRNILNDFWALRYNPAIAEERLQKAIAANLLKVKTWMIRCTDKVFQRCIERQIENRKILGSNSTVEDYLSKRLECSLENAKYLTEKYPQIMKMNISKMKEILDFLYEQGYSPGHVCRVPRIMIHSQETTKQRILHLVELGHAPPTLASLCKSKRDFDKLLKKYIKRQMSKEMQK